MSNYNILKTADTITASSIVDGAITTGKLNASVTTLIVQGSSPKVAAITYPGNDLAADTAGSQTITLTGTGFVSGCSVFIGATQVSVVTVVSATSVTFTSPALAAATYTLYLVNPDGGTATIVPGISYSGTPAWTTAAGPLGSVYEYSAISNTVAATGDGSIVYSVVSGTLPTGSSLNTSTGVITGTSPASAGATTYTFDIRATDAQLQDSDRSFSITVNTDVVTWTTPADNSTTALSKDVASSTTLLATSAAGKAITYTANALPTGLSISGSAVTGTPTVIGNTASLFTATAATTSRTATRTINWTVSVASDTYFPYTTMLLSGATTTETFVTDASTNNFALAIVNDTKPNNFNPYTPGYYSMYSPTTSDYYSYSDTTTGNFGTGDFTVEGWFYLTASGHNLIVATSQGPLSWEILTYGNQFYWHENAGNYGGGGYGTVPTNQWVHLAASRTGGYLNLYINGVRVLNSANTYNYSGTPTRYIGPAVGGANSFWLSNVRFIKGTGIYSGATITVPTSPLTAIANTSLLTAQSNRMIDNSANAIVFTKAGSPTVQSFTPFVPNTQYAAYGSTYFDGGADYLTTPNNAALQFGTGDFTVELWAYITGGSSWRALISKGAAATGWSVIINDTGYWAFSDSALNYGGSILATSTNWTHIAFTRSGTTTKLFVNGIQAYSTTLSTDYNQTNQLVIGAARDTTIPFTGHIANARVVKGVAVYTANFTPPTAPLTATQSANTNGNPSAAITGTATSLLTCQTNQPASNSMFLDSSTNALAVTRAGNVSAGTFSPYGANWSTYFDGSTDWITLPSSASAYNLTGNFTVECWVYATAQAGADWGIIDARVSGATAAAWLVLLAPSGTGHVVRFYNAGPNTGTTVIPLNTWAHIAVTRSGTALRTFVNGVVDLNNASYGSGAISPGTTAPRLGTTKDALGTSYMTKGYISNFRFVNGTALYTGTFTPSTTPLTSTSQGAIESQVKLLTHQSNGLVDNSTNAFALTPSTSTVSVQRFSPFSPQTQTAITHSAYFDGSGDYLTVPNNAAFNLGSGNFTIEFWVNTTSTAAYATALRLGDTWTTGSWSLYLNNAGGSGAPSWWSFTLNASLSTSGATINDGAWHHIALVRNSATMTMYIDGISRGTLSVSANSVGDTSTSLWIARDASNVRELAGYLSNIRIVKGTAVYTAAFTVPTSPLTATQSSGTNIAAITGTQTSLLTCQSATFVDNSTNSFALTVTGETRPRTVNPFGFTNATAAYSAATYVASAYFDGAGDSLTTTNSSIGLNLSASEWTIEGWIYLTTFQGTDQKMFVIDSTLGTFGFFFKTAGGIWCSAFGSNERRLSADGSIIVNTWKHIAFTKIGASPGTIRCYIDGIATAYTITDYTFPNTNSSFSLGDSITQYSNANYKGYFSNVRVVKGTAVYKSNFVPPVAPLTAITNTSLLLNMTSAGIYDSASGNNLETVADAKRVSTHTPYAGSYYSNYFDGTGDYLSTPNLGSITANFTIDFWYYPEVPTNTWYPYVFGSNTPWVNGIGMLYPTQGGVIDATTLSVQVAGVGATVSTFGAIKNKWNHIAVVRSGGIITVYLNGASACTLNNSATILTTTYYIGGVDEGGNYDNHAIKGYISNFRVVNGTAVYTGTFTPPALPATATQGPVSLSPPSTVEYLVVAGGGGGGRVPASGGGGAGGGGAGGYRTASEFAVAANTLITVTVGSGGPGAATASTNGTNGTNSVFSTITSIGGGGGAFSSANGNSGGSGGGGGQTGGTGGAGTSGQGNAGATSVGNNNAGQGGGGAGAIGSAATVSNQAGNGGAGLYSSITGASTPYAGGGGGGNYGSGAYGLGGIGGGGAGGFNTVGVDGTANTGGGGGGYGGTGSANGGAGGKGVVIIRHADSYAIATCTGSPVITVAGGYKIYKFLDSGTITFNTETIAAISGSATSLLTCQSNRFVDNSTNSFAITKYNNTSVQSFNPFQRNSGTSLYFDGTGDWLFGPAIPSNILTGNFTIELWVYPVVLSGQMGIFNLSGTSGSGSNSLAIYFDNGNTISFWVNGSSGGVVTTSNTYTTGAWYHIALVRNGSTNTLYVNGISSAANSVTPTTALQPIGIGRLYNDNASYSLNGYINDLRITKGIARYPAASVPTTAFTAR